MGTGGGGGLIRRRGLETSSTCLGASRQTRGSCLSAGELPEGARGVWESYQNVLALQGFCGD